MAHALRRLAIRYHADINESRSSTSRYPPKDRFLSLSLSEMNRRVLFRSDPANVVRVLKREARMKCEQKAGGTNPPRELTPNFGAPRHV
jgi:hypothetical protein